MNAPFIEKLEQLMISAGLATPDQLRGCSLEEVAQLEKDMGVTLPSLYCQFLLRMGRQAGGVFVGTDVFYGQLRRLRDWANELIAESGSSFVLPTDSFVFYMHQGYVFLYFRTTQGEDPPVYKFTEGDQEPKVINMTFSEFVLSVVESEYNVMVQRANFRRSHGLE